MIALFSIPLLLFFSCTLPEVESAQYTREGFDFPYDLDRPDTTFLLPYELTEISGLSAGPDPHTLACNQDEKGYVFIIDKKSGQVTRRIRFGKDNDYEGVERVGNSIYVVKSTGTLYEITDMNAAQTDAEKHSNDLDGDYDVEGLGYDPVEKVLLLACKAEGDDGKKDERQIYAFDPLSKSLFPDPWYIISHDAIREFVTARRDQGGEDKPFFEALSEKISDEFDFWPSGICIHPETGHFYVISSKANALIVLDREGALLAYAQLHIRLFPQPEGITIDENGDLYISSEGNRSRGRVLMFRPGN